MRAAVTLLLLLVPLCVRAGECPAPLNATLPKLHSSDTLDLCQFAGKPLLVVNTASFCGFTKQFAGLQHLYETYHEQGLNILGVPSDDFRQEADDQAETANVCYINYGVTFPMTAPQPVKGGDALPLFRYLAEEGGGAPRWNFYKFLLDADGKVVGRFSSRVAPDDDKLIRAVESVLP